MLFFRHPRLGLDFFIPNSDHPNRLIIHRLNDFWRLDPKLLTQAYRYKLVGKIPRKILLSCRYSKNTTICYLPAIHIISINRNRSRRSLVTDDLSVEFCRLAVEMDVCASFSSGSCKVRDPDWVSRWVVKSCRVMTRANQSGWPQATCRSRCCRPHHHRRRRQRNLARKQGDVYVVRCQIGWFSSFSVCVNISIWEWYSERNNEKRFLTSS